MLLNLGVNNSVQRFYFDSEMASGNRPAIVSTGLLQLMVSVVLGVAVVFALAHHWREAIEASYGVPWLLICLALLTIVPDQIAQYTLDAVRLQFAPLRFLAISVIKNAAGIVLGVWFLIHDDMGLAGIMLGMLIAAAIAAPVGLWAIRPNLTFAIDPGITGRIFHFGFPYVLAGAAYWVFGSMDRWMLAEYSNLEQVGLFSIAFKFAAALGLVISAFGQAWSPFAYKASAEDPGYRRFFAQILTGWFFVLALLAFGLSILSREIVEFITPPAYWSAAPMLAVGVCGVALYGTTLITSMGVSLEKKTMLLSAAAWAAAAVNVTLNFILIPLLGGMGAAFSTLASYAVLTGAMLYWSQKLHPLPLEWRKLGYSALMLLAAMLIAAYWNEPTRAVAIPVKLALCCVVIAGAFWTGVLSPDVYHNLKRWSSRTVGSTTIM
jgi:O-antigen/teichoic acid export membrane protein